MPGCFAVRRGMGKCAAQSSGEWKLYVLSGHLCSPGINLVMGISYAAPLAGVNKKKIKITNLWY
jgi:hypothetical protein